MDGGDPRLLLLFGATLGFESNLLVRSRALGFRARPLAFLVGRLDRGSFGGGPRLLLRPALSRGELLLLLFDVAAHAFARQLLGLPYFFLLTR